MAWIPAAAAAANKRREEEESHLIGELQKNDIDDRYEYKILRSSGAAFRKADRRTQVLMEEARAGWDMVQMIDYSRLIMRRDKAMRDQDTLLTDGIDPYRIYVDGNRTLLIALTLFAVIALIPLVLALLFMTGDGITPGTYSILVVMGMIFVLMIVASIVAIKRKSR